MGIPFTELFSSYHILYAILIITSVIVNYLKHMNTTIFTGNCKLFCICMKNNNNKICYCHKFVKIVISSFFIYFNSIKIYFTGNTADKKLIPNSNKVICHTLNK